MNLYQLPILNSPGMQAFNRYSKPLSSVFETEQYTGGHCTLVLRIIAPWMLDLWGDQKRHWR